MSSWISRAIRSSAAAVRSTCSAGSPSTATSWRYHSRWADDASGERRALADWFAWLEPRLAAHPGLHVYHYAPYEPAALRRLVGMTGVGAAPMDRLLREHRFVDLMTVTRQALRIGIES